MSDLAPPRSATREICEKQKKYFKGKFVTFTVQSLILYQYPVDLLTFLKLSTKKVLSILKWQIRTCCCRLSKQFCPGAVEKPVYVGEMTLESGWV